MSNDINKVILVGRLVRDPELRSTNNGVYLCRFTLASNRTIYVKDGNNKEDVGFFDFLAWGNMGEVISRYGKKGKRMAVDGYLKHSTWDNAEGKRQSKIEIVVDHFQFLDPANREEHASLPDNEPANSLDNFNELFNDDIPF